MITLYTSTTPNGYKISIALEELQLPYEIHAISLSQQEQKQDWFLKLNINGKIPVIVDHDNDDFVLAESGAILWYLAEKAGKLLPENQKKRFEVMQWLLFQVGGLGPMQGQAHVFYRYAPEKIPFAIARYQDETQRLYSVLDQQLKDKNFIVDDYSVADIAIFPWIARHEWAGVAIDEFTELNRWYKNISKREAVIRGLKIPEDKGNDDTTTRAERGKKII